MKPFGSWFNESASAAKVEIQLKKVEPVDGLIGTLQAFADWEIPCGCVPCTGQCWSKESLRIEIEAMRDEAIDALKKYEAQS